MSGGLRVLTDMLESFAGMLLAHATHMGCLKGCTPVTRQCIVKKGFFISKEEVIQRLNTV